MRTHSVTTLIHTSQVAITAICVAVSATTICVAACVAVCVAIANICMLLLLCSGAL